MTPTRTPPAEPLRLALRAQPRSVSSRFSVAVIRCAPASLREQAICEREQTGGVVRIGWPEWCH